MDIRRQYSIVRDVIFLLLIIYFSQGSLYESGSIISRGALGLILIISGVFFLKTIIGVNNKNSFYKIWTFIYCVNIIGYLFFTPEYGGSYFSYFKVISLNFLLFYPFYFFSQNDLLKSKHLIRFFIIFIPIGINLFFYNMTLVMEEYDRLEDAVVNNISYLFVNLMPYVFLFRRKKILSLGAMLLLMYFIIQGSKRGAILVGGIGLILFVYYQLKTLEGRQKIFAFIASAIGLFGILYYAYNKLLENEFVLERFEVARGGSYSGREIIFANIWKAWLNSGEYIHYLFGYGFAGSLHLTGGSYAHSDWLEMLSNFGLLGIVTYSLFFWISIKISFTSGWKADKRIIFLTALGIWFFTSIASMSMYDSLNFLLVILFAYLIGSSSKVIN